MSESIPESHLDLIEGPVYITLATVMPDGQPQATIVWCNYDDPYVLVNTRRERQKAINMRERPMATILALDPDNPYRYLEVRGTVDEVTEEGAVDHINALAMLYANKPYFGGVVPAEQEKQYVRVMCKIRPTRVRTVG